MKMQKNAGCRTKPGAINAAAAKRFARQVLSKSIDQAGGHHKQQDHMRKFLTSSARTVRKEISVYQSVLKDPRCPRLARYLLGGAIAYAASPIDLIPDFIPVIGHLDDVILVPLLIWLGVRLIPKTLIAEHRVARINEGL